MKKIFYALNSATYDLLLDIHNHKLLAIVLVLSSFLLGEFIAFLRHFLLSLN